MATIIPAPVEQTGVYICCLRLQEHRGRGQDGVKGQHLGHQHLGQPP